MEATHVDVGEDVRFFAASIATRHSAHRGPHLVLLTLNLDDDPRIYAARHDMSYRVRYRWLNRSTAHYVRFPLSNRVVRFTKYAKVQLYGNTETWFAPMPAEDAVAAFAGGSAALLATAAPRTKLPWEAAVVPCPIRVTILDGQLQPRGNVSVCLDAALSAPLEPRRPRYDFAMCFAPPTPELLPHLAESIAYHSRHGVDQVHACMSS